MKKILKVILIFLLSKISIFSSEKALGKIVSLEDAINFINFLEKNINFNIINDREEIEKIKESFSVAINLLRQEAKTLKSDKNLREKILVSSIFLNSYEDFKNFIKLNVELNSYKRENLLKLSIINQNHEITKDLIKYGFSLNKKDEFGIPPLAWAIYVQDLKLIKLLVESGADINFIIEGALSILDIARETENREIISYLKKQKALSLKEMKSI